MRPAGERGHLGLARGRRGADPGHEEDRRRPAPRPGAVPRAGRPSPSSAPTSTRRRSHADARRAPGRDPQAGAVRRRCRSRSGDDHLRRHLRRPRRRAGRQGPGVREGLPRVHGATPPRRWRRGDPHDEGLSDEARRPSTRPSRPSRPAQAAARPRTTHGPDPIMAWSSRNCADGSSPSATSSRSRARWRWSRRPSSAASRTRAWPRGPTRGDHRVWSGTSRACSGPRVDRGRCSEAARAEDRRAPGDVGPRPLRRLQLEPLPRARGLARRARRRPGGGKVDFFVYGRKGYQYLSKRGRGRSVLPVDPPLEQIDYARRRPHSARPCCRRLPLRRVPRRAISLHGLRVDGEVLPCRPGARFLPIEDQPEGLEEAAPAMLRGSDIILEPDAETIFDARAALPRDARLQRVARVPDLRVRQRRRRLDEERDRRRRATCRASLRGAYNRQAPGRHHQGAARHRRRRRSPRPCALESSSPTRRPLSP